MVYFSVELDFDRMPGVARDGIVNPVNGGVLSNLLFNLFPF
jgi:hypothetical protein